MLFYIIYNSEINDKYFRLWLNHNKRINADFKIYVEKKELENFKNNYPYYSSYYLIDYIPNKNITCLSENDFLFSYSKNEIDEMILSYNINFDSIINTPINIGRVFSVPVKGKPTFTTFEIPDFILYQHANHTNYTNDGLILNNMDGVDKNDIKISNNIVCFNLKTSKVAFDKEYYETNIISENWKTPNNVHDAIFFKNVYETFFFNVIVNKEKQYGFIWFSKCACTTITHVFCELNKIKLADVQKRRSLNFNIPNKHHFNNYLQNIDFLSFYRNPYHRFISIFIDKHVYKSDSIYVTLDGYKKYIEIYKKDTLYNLIQYLLNDGYISEHFSKITDNSIFYTYNNKNNNCNCKMINMKDGVNNNLNNFLKKYYHESVLDFFDILNCHENSIESKQSIKNSPSSQNTYNIKINNEDEYDYEKLKYFDEIEWKDYLSNHKLDYEDILKDDYIKNNIYKLFENDIKALL
jgi:hypothetical protein